MYVLKPNLVFKGSTTKMETNSKANDLDFNNQTCFVLCVFIILVYKSSTHRTLFPPYSNPITLHKRNSTGTTFRYIHYTLQSAHNSTIKKYGKLR